MIIRETENSYVIDRSSMFPEKAPAVYNKSDFHVKFYKGLLEGKPKTEQLEMF